MVEMESIRLRYADSYLAHARLWLPQKLRGAVLYLHGIQSHGLWFETSAGRLAQAGYAVLLPDRRGSGRNEVERGHARSVWRLLRDATEGMDELHIRTGLHRFHVVGVSWGGKLALGLYRYVPTRVASLTLIAPGLFPKVDIPLTHKLRVGWSAITNRRATFDIPLQDPELFTANAARQAFIRDDRLALRKVTAAFLMASRKLDRYAQEAGLKVVAGRRAPSIKCPDMEPREGDEREADRAGCENRVVTAGGAGGSPETCPVHVFLAGQDRIIDNARTKRFVRGLPWPRRGITEYPDAHHTLEFEPEPEQFLKDLLAWIDESTVSASRCNPGQ